MLNGIPAILPPELVKYMMEMGHGETLTISDAHFPAASYGIRSVCCPGVTAPQLLDAILTLFPLDKYVDVQVELMQVVKGDNIGVPPVWKTIEETVEKHDKDAKIGFRERFDFYEESKKSYVIVQSGDTAQYANIIVRKGIVKNSL